jgi:Zn-dependent protease with chaperone function
MATTADFPGSGADPLPCRLFGSGIAATGIDARLTLAATQLEVRTGTQTLRAPLTTLRVREVVNVHRGLELAWDQPRAAFAVQVVDEAAVRALRMHPVLRDLPQWSQLQTRQRRSRLARWVGINLLWIWLLLPALLIGLLVWQAPRLVTAATDLVSIEDESRLGRRVFSSMRDKLKLEDAGARPEAVRSLGRRLTQGSAYTYEFHVVADSSINAFALPGGVIVVHTGLLDAVKRPEELAGVLAHEVQHVEQRHSLRSLVRGMGLRGAWAVLTGNLGGTLAGQAALELTALRFSRGAEREADIAGFDTLVRLDIDPQGMADFFGTLAASRNGAPPAWLSTHPPSEARQQKLREMRAALGTRQFPALELPGLRRN